MNWIICLLLHPAETALALSCHFAIWRISILNRMIEFLCECKVQHMAKAARLNRRMQEAVRKFQ